MIKRRKIFLSVIVLFLFLGSILIFMHYQKQKEDNKYFSIQEQRVEKFLKYNTSEFKSIKFTKRDVSPMGTPYIEGYINDDKTLDFSADVEPNDHNFEGSLGMSTKLREMMNVDLKNYSEIIREEKNER